MKRYFLITKINIRKIIIPALIILLPLVIFRRSFSVYFFQDDFFALSISEISKLKDLFRFFVPRDDIQFYRPLSVEIYYFINRSLFGLNPLPFHIIGWLFFFINILLVYSLSSFYLNKKISSLIITLLYATSSIHYDSLFWLANFSYILGTTFYFLGFYIYKKYSSKFYAIIFTVFIFGLLSSELLITLPIVIFFDSLISREILNKEKIILISGLFLLMAVYLYMRFSLFKVNTESYNFMFGSSALSSFRFFILFFLNFPETIKDQLINFYSLRKDFFESFPFQTIIFTANLLIFPILLFFIPISELVRMRKLGKYLTSNWDTLIFALSWTIITLIPVIFIQVHFSPHYGSISLFGFLLLFLILLESLMHKTIQNAVIAAVLSSWIVSSVVTVELNNEIHWIIRRSETAKNWLFRIKKEYPNLKQGSTIVIPTDNKDSKVALNDGRALKILYNDTSLTVLFQKSLDNKISIK